MQLFKPLLVGQTPAAFNHLGSQTLKALQVINILLKVRIRSLDSIFEMRTSKFWEQRNEDVWRLGNERSPYQEEGRAGFLESLCTVN